MESVHTRAIRLEAENKKLREQVAALLEVVRCYNPDDAVLDHEKEARHESLQAP